MARVLNSVIAVAALMTMSVAASAQTAVTIAHGSNQVEITHPGLYLPRTLGWAKEEGLDVTVQTTAGSQQALQLLAAGRADFITVNPETIINARDQGVKAKIVYSMVTKYSAQIAALADGPIKTVADMKGTQIGVFSLQSGGVPFLKAVLREAGLNADTDVKMVPTGAGAPGLQALNSGTVSAIALWAGAFAVYENQGAKLRIFTSSRLSAAPGYILATTEDILATKPELVAKMGRVFAKAGVFAMANPNAAVEAYWVAYPQAKPMPMSDKAFADAKHVLEVGVRDMAVADRPDKRWGWTNPQGIEVLQTYLVENGARQTVLPGGDIFANDHVAAYNQFDAAAVQNQAKAYKP